jgi:hypothetical protein
MQEFWDSIKKLNLQIIEEEVQAKGTGKISKKVKAANFPNLEKEMPLQVQEAFRTPNRQDHNGSSPHHIIVKTLSLENKENLLKTIREKCQVNYKGKPIRIMLDLAAETLRARKAWKDVLQALGKKITVN